MPQINLGRVKGNPLTWDDLTDEQKTSLKGEKGEKGDTPEVIAGTTTIVEYKDGVNAAVTSETKEGVTSFNFKIPVGQKPPFYGSYDTFPEIGEVNRIYIDNTVDPRLMYTWDLSTLKYISTGGTGGEEQVFFGAFADFPTTGNSEMLYVDTSNTSVLVMYRWNGNAYVPSGGGAVDLDVVAKPFDPEKPYTEGEYVIEAGELYRFKSDKAAGAWDASVVDPTTVGVELSDLNAKIIQVETETATATLTKNVTVQNSVNLLKKNGKIVNLMLGINANNATLTQYQGNIAGSIPSGFFPSKEVWTCAISQAKGYYVFRISPAGEIIIQPFDAKAANNNIFFINITWILD